MGKWLKILSYIALLGFPLSVLGTRLGLFDFRVGFTGLSYTLFLAVGVFLLALIVAVTQRKSNPDIYSAARIAAIISLLPILAIGSQVITARSVPSIHNISTDTIDPPKFAKIAEIRTALDNPLFYDSEKLAAVQQQAYPQVKTILTKLNTTDAHAKAIVVAEALGWVIVSESVVAGIIEATQTSALWGFKDDIVIRVRDVEGQAIVDLRSVSRVGKSDLGANAKRIQKFINVFTQS